MFIFPACVTQKLCLKRMYARTLEILQELVFSQQPVYQPGKL